MNASDTGSRARQPAGRWAARAELAERAVRARHLRRLWGLPGTLLGVSGRPATPTQLVFGSWNYWWQAHVLDCLVDAYVRGPEPHRRLRVSRFVNGVRRRNAKGWLNDYYDDMAWLALALQRAEQVVGVRRSGAVNSLAEALHGGWSAESGGGIWWRKHDKYDEDFKNTPTNGPAAILFARLHDRRAYDTAHWLERHLVDPETGVVWDGLHVSRAGGIREIETVRYAYCQGVYLGACLELAAWGDDGEATRWAQRAERTIDAVAAHLTVPAPASAAAAPAVSASAAVALAAPGAAAALAPPESPLILRGQGGGDGGLFGAILARYLAQAALTLPEFGPGFGRAAALAADLVLDSAQAAWDHRAADAGASADGPIFGPDWSTPAEPPRRRGAERDLSVQVGAWMLLEAAALLARRG